MLFKGAKKVKQKNAERTKSVEKFAFIEVLHHNKTFL